MIRFFPALKPILMFLWIGFAFFFAVGQEGPVPIWSQAGGIWKVSVEHVLWEEGQDEPADYLRVYVGIEDSSGEQPAIAGNYSVESDTLIFTPLFPFRQGITYRAQYKSSPSISFQIPKQAPRELAQILSIYPSLDSLPANQLKLFIHFSQPMRQGVAYEHLLWSDESGNLLPSPFLQLQPELWDETGTILTLWFDPGRVKRALGPNKAWGAPMEEGQTYLLSIDSTWTTTEGYPLSHSISKSIFAVSEDRSKPDVSDWIVSSPSSGTRMPLVIEFGEAMDHLLLTRTFELKNSRNEVIQGNIDIGQAEKNWHFSPDVPWKTGQYRIEVESRLEDLAGNNLNRLFDREIGQETNHQSDQEVYELLFYIE